MIFQKLIIILFFFILNVLLKCYIIFMFTGLLIYLFYGIGHSLEGNKQKIQLNTIQIKPKLSS